MLKRLYLADVGGEATSDGRQVRMGLLYRSSGLHRLHTDDLATVRGLGLRHIIDLREAGVVAKQPDRVQAEVMTHLPMGFASLEAVKPSDVLLRRVKVRDLFHSRFYAEVLDVNGHTVCAFLDSLLDKPLPALVHCNAGKDRTGMVVAALYLALGVPREQIVQAYMAVMPHLQQYFPNRLKALVRMLGGPPLAYSVMPEYMEGMLDAIEENHGGANGYFQSIGFTRVESLRERLLETAGQPPHPNGG